MTPPVTRFVLEPAVISCYPRDDVRYAAEEQARGNAYVYDAEVLQSPAARIDPGDYRMQSLDFPVCTLFSVHVTAQHAAGDDLAEYEHTYRFRVTQDETDVGDYTVGPGLVTEPGPWWSLGRKQHSGFEFGVRIMGAVPATEDR